MAIATVNPISAAALVALAAYLMTSAGLGQKQLRRRSPTCRVCHRPGSSCTCRWL
jgi:hypothetical protein